MRLGMRSPRAVAALDTISNVGASMSLEYHSTQPIIFCASNISEGVHSRVASVRASCVVTPYIGGT